MLALGIVSSVNTEIQNAWQTDTSKFATSCFHADGFLITFVSNLKTAFALELLEMPVQSKIQVTDQEKCVTKDAANNFRNAKKTKNAMNSTSIRKL
jgi:hypothetical protein